MALILLATFTFACNTGNCEKTVIATMENTKTNHSVVLLEIGNSFTFGPSTVQVLLKNATGEILDAAEASIYNDGKAITANNISVIWTDTCAHITLHGEEQQDESLILQYIK